MTWLVLIQPARTAGTTSSGQACLHVSLASAAATLWSQDQKGLGPEQASNDGIRATTQPLRTSPSQSQKLSTLITALNLTLTCRLCTASPRPDSPCRTSSTLTPYIAIPYRQTITRPRGRPPSFHLSVDLVLFHPISWFRASAVKVSRKSLPSTIHLLLLPHDNHSKTHIREPLGPLHRHVETNVHDGHQRRCQEGRACLLYVCSSPPAPLYPSRRTTTR